MPANTMTSHHHGCANWGRSCARRSGSIVRESGNIIAEPVARIFADLADPQAANSAADRGWKEPLWRALAETGLTLAWVGEQHGGSGASLADGIDILRVTGRFAAPVPLAETLLAGWLLSRAEIASPAGAMSVAPALPGDHIAVNPDGTLNSRAPGGPFAAGALPLGGVATRC